MEIKKVILAIVLLLPFFVNAQETKAIGDVTVFESQAFKEKEKTNYILSFNKSDSGKTVLLRGAKRKLILDVFGGDFSKLHTKVIKREKKKEWCVGTLFYDDYLRFFTVYKPKRRERIVYCHTLNLNNFTYEKKELFKKELKKGGSLFYSRKNKETNVAISPNHKYFVIATNNSTKKINSSSVHVYNTEDLSLMYTKSYQTHEENKYTHNSISVDNNANVYSLGKIDIGSFLSYNSSNKEQRKEALKKKKESKSNYEFVLNQINEDTTKEVSIGLDSVFVRSLTISNLEDKLNLFGFYSEKNEGRIKGGCSFSVKKKNLSIVRKKRDELPLEVYQGLYGEKRAVKKKKKARELSRFYIDYILRDEEEGSTYILAEQFYITSYYVATANGGYMRSEPHYDDILIVKFNEAGDLEWGRGVYKKDGVPSYNAFLKDHKLHVVLNTGRTLKEQKNGRTKLSKSFFGLGTTALYDFSYTNKGKVTRTKIQDNKSKGTTKYHPYLGVYENKKFVMMSISTFRRRFMVLE